MSLIDNLKGRAAPLGAPDVQAKLKIAEADLAALEAQHGQLALDALNGGNEAAKALTALQAQLLAGRERVGTLKAAHKTALERDEAAARAQLASLRRSQVAAIRKHLEARDAAADIFVKSIAEASAAYRTLLERSEKARAACPIGMNWPVQDGGANALKRLVANEIYRNGASVPLPVPAAPDLNGLAVRESIPPMTNAIKRESEIILSALTSKLTA